ncbi:uncharacterized protein RAG0_02985 [Rhynchosporium agropyri]|uniref:NB-ARC domain-containing protein n=1 Tax=Rhynchosporium agropyri TaxID=914238 RepID=A0A1E1K2T6_9HELO|nr:uncharacterized protein RAG0_02985 [Rhynchosporium agropyri]
MATTTSFGDGNSGLQPGIINGSVNTQFHRRAPPDRSPETWVFWVRTSNAARFEQSFRDIADRVKILGRQNLTANIFRLVHDWLCDERKGKWLLILDNVDDVRFLVEAQWTGQDGQASNLRSENSQPLVSYLPQCQNGTILTTTRSTDAAKKVVKSRDIITVEPMSKGDGLLLLEKKLGSYGDGNGGLSI